MTMINVNLISGATYLARVLSWGVKTFGHENKIKVWVKLNVSGHELFWEGFPEGTEKALEIVKSSLKAMGFQGHSLRSFVTDSKALDTDKPVEVVVAEESWTDKNTGALKSKFKVAFIGTKEYSEEFLNRISSIEIGDPFTW